MLSKLIIVCLIFIISSCKPKVEFKEIKKTSLANNASLPEKLVEELSSIFLEQNPDLKISLKKVKAKFGFYKKVEWPLNMSVWPKNSQLEGIAKKFVVSEGAVRIDLNNFINQLEGEDSFYLKINLKTQKFNKLYVYFLPSHKIDKACNKFYDISTFYQKKLLDKVLLTKKEDHYIKNYLGTYVFFSVLNKEAYQLNLLQITNSALGDKLCHYF